MKTLLATLSENRILTRKESKKVFMDIVSDKYNTSQIAAFTSVFMMRAITVDELAGFRDAMMELCVKVKFDVDSSIDIVGTGGDGKDTFNISTLSCFVVAGTGIKVTKHGSYGVSSISGSSDVLEAIGYKFTDKITTLQKELDKAGICFMHAPLFHPVMKKIASLRKDLGIRTFFNMLGPIVNPCSPEYQLLGTSSLEMQRLYNYLLQTTDKQYAIVHSLDGYDEISLTSPFRIISKHEECLLTPQEIGFEKLDQKDLSYGKSIENATELFIRILNNECTMAQRNVICANSAIAIRCVYPEKSIEECILIAQESLESKKALHVLKQLLN